MQLASPARQLAPSFGVHLLMPTPSPLGRLIKRRRGELGLTQKELAMRVGHGMEQRDISRLETGFTQRMNDHARMDALGKALGLESHEEFVLAAYAPNAIRKKEQQPDPDVELLSLGPDGELIALVRRIPQHRKRQAVEFLRIMAEDEQPES